MRAAGWRCSFPLDKLAVRGYVEVIRHYREIRGIRNRLAEQLLKEPPTLFIGVDAPDFNLGLEARLKAAGVPTVHYVSPSIWAWRAGRIRKIRRAVSKMLLVFPFEAVIYERAGIPAVYVGHPLADLPRRISRTGGDARAVAPAALRKGHRAPSGQSPERAAADGRALRRHRAADSGGGPPRSVFLVPLATRETRDLFEAELLRRETGAPAAHGALRPLARSHGGGRRRAGRFGHCDPRSSAAQASDGDHRTACRGCRG
jgi:lipid-A-disaccharide synthase